MISKEIIHRLRKEYPIGCRVELIKMDDPQAPPAGTRGTVTGVDDIGSIMVDWDNGSGLNACYGEDIIKRVSAMTEEIKEQILAIRDTGKTNMFDSGVVQRLALDAGYFELVHFIEDHIGEYAAFILYGDKYLENMKK